MTKQEKLDNYVNDLCSDLESENYHSEHSILTNLVSALAEQKVSPDVALKVIQDINFWS